MGKVDTTDAMKWRRAFDDVVGQLSDKAEEVDKLHEVIVSLRLSERKWRRRAIKAENIIKKL